MKTDELAQTVWDYMLLNQPIQKSDAIFVLGSIDERVAEYAAKLWHEGYGEWLIFSGGVASSSSWKGSEADHFADIAVRLGVPTYKILTENKATNTGENIIFTKALLDEKGINPNSLLLVQKPYMERRTYATFAKQWPDKTTTFTATSPPIAYDEYFNSLNPKKEGIGVMLGDLQRIREYPKLGFQVEQDIPTAVWSAYEQLVALGYGTRMIKN